MKLTALARIFAASPAVLLLLGFQSMTPRDILRRSVQAHGGDSLTNWKTLTIRGTVDMQDGITYRSAYLVFAKAPGRLRIEKDMTAARGGRYFYEYFLNEGLAWSRRNLIPDRGNLEEMRRWMAQCYGIAHYAGKADTLVRKEDAVVEWKEKKDLQSNVYQVVASRPAFVIAATIGKETADLCIDRENFQFLQESFGRTRRIFWNFRKFGEVTMPTQVLEIVTTSRGEQVTPYAYESVKFDAPVEDWLFTEDMPKTAGIRK